MRDIVLGDTIDIKFTTAAPDTGAPATLSGTPVISAYVGNSATQITAGITLSVDFDGVTGLNNVRVVASSGNGFADGTDVALIITTGTVDGNSAVGYKVAEFTIGRSPAYRRLGAPAGASISADIATIDGNVDAILVDTGTTLPASLATIDGNVDSILTDTGTTLPASLATIDQNVDAILVDTAEIGAAGAGLTEAGGTGDHLTALATAAALETVDGNVDSILVDTGTTLPARLTGIEGATFDTDTDSLEAIRNRGDAAWTTGAGGSAPTVGEIADAVWDEALSGHTTEGSAGEILGNVATGTPPSAEAIRQEIDANSTQLAAIVADTNELQGDWEDGGRLDLILDARASQTSVDTIDNLLDTEVAAILVDTGTTLPALINALNDLSQADIRTAVGLATANLDTQLAALPTAAENRAEMDSNSTQLAAIVADTNELQTDDVPGLIGALDTLIDAIKAKTDSLTFTQTGQVDANIQRINDVTITGNGQTGSEFSV